jgi:hypothetical protein
MELEKPNMAKFGTVKKFAIALLASIFLNLFLTVLTVSVREVASEL